MSIEDYVKNLPADFGIACVDVNDVIAIARVILKQNFSWEEAANANLVIHVAEMIMKYYSQLIEQQHELEKQKLKETEGR